MLPCRLNLVGEGGPCLWRGGSGAPDGSCGPLVLVGDPDIEAGADGKADTGADGGSDPRLRCGSR